MSLEIAEYPVRDLVFSDITSYEDGVLQVHVEELRSLALQDSRIRDVSVELACPGEEVRITFLCDAVDARVKVRGPGAVFPGTLNPPDPAGDGRTHVLTGLTIMVAGEIPSASKGSLTSPRGTLLDMHHPLPDTPFHHTRNLVLVLSLQPGLLDGDYHAAIQGAEMRVAQRLAETTLEHSPTHLRVHTPEPRDSQLPRIVLVQHLRGNRGAAHPAYALYGFLLEPGQSPLFVRPTEFFDGAVTSSTLISLATHLPTWQWCNHPLVQALCRDHGKGINFLGALLVVRSDTLREKQFMAQSTARLARAMGARGALISNLGIGNGLVDAMLQFQWLEREGIKTVLVTYEHGPDSVDSPRLAFGVPEADAIVSVGTEEIGLELGPARRVIGPAEIPVMMDTAPNTPRVPAAGPLSVHVLRPMFGSLDFLGHGFATIREY